MEPYAKAADYRAVYDTDADDERLDAMLAKASRKIRSALSNAGLPYTDLADEAAEAAADVACDMVHRVLGDGDSGAFASVPFGATQMSQAGGPYSASISLANPYGDLFITKSERELLGIDAAAVGSIVPMLPEDREDMPC